MPGLLMARYPTSDRMAASNQHGITDMKADIHPNYVEITANCSCGNSFQTRSTLGKGIHLDVCANCHPFYTGKQKVADAGGRVDRFRQRFGARSTKV